MLQDLKNACRALLKTPWFTCVVVLTLALGIGANTAIFGVVNRLLLNPLPYPDAERLVYLELGIPQVSWKLSPPNYVASAWRERARALDGIEAYEFRTLLAYDDRGARVVSGMRITAGLPAFLGVAPLLGRGFVATDAEAGAPRVVMLSYEVWQRDYGGTSDVVGRAITLDNVPHVVIGVMPARWDAFAGARRAEMWFPLFISPDPAAPASTSPTEYQQLDVLARLRPDVPLDAVTAELDALAKPLLAEAPRPTFRAREAGVRVTTPANRFGTGTRDTLLMLFAAVGLVLLVACSNVANLLLARGASCGASSRCARRSARALGASCARSSPSALFSRSRPVPSARRSVGFCSVYSCA